jgi:tetratricopeptide (TPR) repeat protein
LDPSDADARLNLGNSYYNDNKYPDSIMHYKKAVELSPKWKTARNYLGDAYRSNKQFALALASYNSTLVIDPKDVNAIYGIGLLYVDQKQFLLARRQKTKLDVLDADMAAKLQQKIDAAVNPAVLVKPVTPSTVTTVRPKR